MCSIVSAFYPIKSKFNKNKYMEWGKTFMKLEAPIIFFTEESLVKELTVLREHRPIQFIKIPFEELDTWKYKDHWIENYTRDPERYHSPELYAIWAQKAFFVERAITRNDFHTSYFFWCDFGAFRDPTVDRIILNTFPSTRYFKDTLLLQSMGDLKESDIKGISCNDIRLVGGLWGGSISACLQWKKEYQTMLELFFKDGIFAGKDQTVMLATYLKNRNLATIVKCTKPTIDNWFFLEYLLSDLDEEYRINTTYLPIVSVNIMGGLGNQLFQIAAAYAYAKNENGTLQIVKKMNNGNRPVYWDTICRKLEPYLVSTISTLEQWSEDYATIYKHIGPLHYPGKYLNGYMQSSRYFYEVKDEIRDLFKQDDSILRMKYKYLYDNLERIVVVHARRTDYITYKEVHGPLDANYYKEAVQRMSENVKNPIYVLTSDDNTFWEEIKYIFNDYVILDDTDINLFTLLPQFNNFIMANSSFIWWIVWLSNAKYVIAPSKWFGPAGPPCDDIYEDHWILI